MPFARPTRTELIELAKADVAAAVDSPNPLLSVSNLGILATLLGEGFAAEYAYLDWISKQATPFRCDEDAFEAWAALKNQTRKPASAATGTATWPGTPGALLPAGTGLAWNGQAYTTVADATVGGGGTVTAAFTADVPGAAGNMPAGAAVLIASAVAGITSVGVGTPVTAGADVEGFEAFRTRVLAVYAAPPQGGSKADYQEWALEVPGVTRAWCSPHELGPGTVVIRFMMDVAEQAFGGFPQGAGGVATDETRDVAAAGDPLLVVDHIFPLQPVTALVYAVIPLQNTVTFTVNLPGASADLKAQISDAIDAAFLTFGAPGGVVANSEVEAAIRALPGTAGFVITAEACTHGAVAPGAAGNITSDAGYLPVRGAITWAP
jgi:uncharacterized phage protein gp47/JayE